ncbi:hypothetical protein [Polymorphospora rubra]|uniref:Uncharacterized protein n=1 Tax=Polymorphospora rubra TaxID=338584 RepID=A0A810N3T9_9ACTN|nr:hypothetical protein [Polymorphospora rubra]BCJ67590.1 hypothetical protein Prubr_46110 [Polymorphospora rubra]
MTPRIESALRETLEREAYGVPVPEDPWPGFARRRGARRRARRVRVAVVAAMLAAAVGIQTNLVPLPGWVPAVPVSGVWSTWNEEPPRGALTADRAWLAGLRRQVADVEDPEGVWRVLDRDAIRIVYADDVGPHRLALLLVPLRLGVVTVSELFWYHGPAGAAAGQMTQSSSSDSDSPVASWMRVDAATGGVAVVVAPVGSTVTIGSGVDYRPSGTLARRQVVVSQASGIGVASIAPTPVDPGITAEVTTSDGDLIRHGVSGSWSGATDTVDPHASTEAMMTTVLSDFAGPAPDRDILRAFVGWALRDSRLTVRDVSVRLRWWGTVNGQAAALLTVRPEGGGVLAYAFHGTPRSMRLDLRLLLPADGADERPLAWRLRAEGRDDATDRVLVVAAAGATAVSLTPHGAAAVAVRLDPFGFGEATLPPDAAATVTARAGDGPVLTTPVPPLENNLSGPPGDTPATRIVP